jgi:predicted enzyme related to lactoylglutathione lyase
MTAAIGVFISEAADFLRVVKEPFDSPVCRTALILDTEGNLLGLHKKKE